MLDLRLPSGIFFSIAGATLVILGLTVNPQAPMTETNVDLYTGVVMLAFGAILLLLARRGQRA